MYLELYQHWLCVYSVRRLHLQSVTEDDVILLQGGMEILCTFCFVGNKKVKYNLSFFSTIVKGTHPFMVSHT